MVLKSKKNNGHPWLYNERNTDVKTLSATELSVLRRLVRDVLETVRYDDTGVTFDLEDGALASAEILDIIAIDPDLDETLDD